MAQTTESRFRVRYAETDQMGMAYYANYLVWMEVGRSDYCRECGFSYRDLERSEQAFLTVAEASCRYLTAARYDDEILVGKDVGEGSCDGDAAGAGEEAVGIEGEGALEEIVAGIAVEERADAGQLCPSIWGFEIGIANDDKALFAVRAVKKAVHHVDGLFFVFGKLLAKRIDAKSCR